MKYHEDINQNQVKPIKLLHVIGGLEVGGAELMLKRLVIAQHLRESEPRIAIVSISPLGEVGFDLIRAGIPVYSLGLRGPFSLPFATWRLCKIIRLMRPQCVQTWMPHADLLGGIVARLMGIHAVVWGIRSTNLHGTSKLTKRLRLLSAWLSKSIPSAIVCAAKSAREAHVAVGYDRERMIVIPNGYDTELYAPSNVVRFRVRCEFGLSYGQFFIGHVGRWNPSKDPLNFVRAIGLLKQRGVLNDKLAKVIMVGRGVNPQDQPSLADALKKYDCGNLFIFTGERRDINELLTGLDLFCLSSRDEAFPNALAEAMATAVPCITTDVGDAGWIVGESGWVIPKEDSGALADAIATVIAEPHESRLRRGTLARARIVQHFSLASAVERFIQVQEAVIQRTPVPQFE